MTYPMPKGYGIAHALGQMGVSNDTIAKATGFEDRAESRRRRPGEVGY